jgi:cytochrome c oxidase cbb3-type subunit I/II
MDQFFYDNKIVKWFAYATMFWGVIGMFAGLLAAMQLVFPELNFSTAQTTFGRVRPVHTNAVIFAFVGSSVIFAQEFSYNSVLPEVDITMLLQLDTFLWAFFFCFVLNLLSSGYPAWRASRIGIVNAISGKLH